MRNKRQAIIEAVRRQGTLLLNIVNCEYGTDKQLQSWLPVG